MRECLSPNCGARRDGLRPELVVLHYTAMDSAQAALERLCDPLAEVSAHYLIGHDGEVIRMVAEEDRAWHAGAGSWQGRGDVNSRSIGIELDNRGTHPFSARQMDALEDVLRGIMGRWGIGPEGVIGHSDMAPDRKFDPGPHFDWARLQRAGLAAGPSLRASARAASVSEEAFVAAAQAAGYTADVVFADLLRAVRLRRAPWRRGPLCADDFAF